MDEFTDAPSPLPIPPTSNNLQVLKIQIYEIKGTDITTYKIMLEDENHFITHPKYQIVKQFIFKNKQ